MVPNRLLVENSSPPSGHYPRQIEQILSLDRTRQTQQTINYVPQSATTRLLSLDEIATQCRVELVLYKDDSNRLGLNSFRALGAPDALVCIATELLKRNDGEHEVNLDRLIPDRDRELLADYCVAARTDGNHGRASLWKTVGSGLGNHFQDSFRIRQNPDQAATDVIRALSDESVSVGPSGAAGLAGLMQVAGNEVSRQAIGFDENSRVFLIGTEAARMID